MSVNLSDYGFSGTISLVYDTESHFTIVQHMPGGETRLIPADSPGYLAWIAAGGIPAIEANGRFLSVVDGVLVVDPNKAAILAAEAATAQNPKDMVALTAIKRANYDKKVAKALNIKI